MAKIQVTTVQKQANVQVIELDASFVIKAYRAFHCLNVEVENNKHEKTSYNKEKQEYEKVLDKNGKPIIECHNVDGMVCMNEVLPFLKELVDALEQ